MTVKKSPVDAIKAENLEPRNDSTATRDAINSLVGALFEDESLYGYADIDGKLKQSSGCNCALVTLLPFPDMDRAYRPDEFYQMSQALGAAHSSKMAELRRRLDECGIGYATPPAAPADDGSYRAEFSYKWAAVHAGLGFIGRNDVFVHHKYGQRVRISCLLLRADISTYSGDIKCECGDCDLCVKACPHSCLTGEQWHERIRRDELIDYSRCATWSRHDGTGTRYLCCYCVMACPWHRRQLDVHTSTNGEV